MARLNRRDFLAASGASVLAGALPLSAQAQGAYPSRPITYVCPFPAGATNDISARIIAGKLAEILGQPVLVENRAGAGGLAGASSVASSAADGYTLLNLSSGVLTTASQVNGADFDPFEDIAPLGFFGHALSAIAVNPDVPVTTLAELIDYAKAHPGELNFGSAGIGSSGHLAGEHLKQLAGIDIVHIPYSGGGAAANDAIAGHVQLLFDVIAGTSVRNGQLRGLAFYGPSAAPQLEGVPSVADAGLPDWQISSFYLTGAPSGLPGDIHAQLTAALDEAIADEGVRSALEDINILNDTPVSIEETTELLRRNYEVSRQIIEAAGIETA